MSSETWQYYYNARWYDAALGRFVTEDPARDGLNWFIYAYNNPLRWIDPTGFYNKYATNNLHEGSQADGYRGPVETFYEGADAMYGYLVEEGDTLTAIAEDVFGEATPKNTDLLASWNGIDDPDNIEVGQKIYAGPQNGSDRAELTKAFDEYQAASEELGYPAYSKINPPFSQSIITSAEGFRDYALSPNHGNAIDLIPGAGADSTIKAGGLGMVVGSGFNSTFGNYAIIDYAGVGPIQYSHMKSPYKGAANGVLIFNGSFLGEMGMTGSGTGPHVDMNHLAPNGPRIQSLLNMGGVSKMPNDETLRKESGYWENVLP